MAARAPHILERWADAGERFAHDNRKTHDVRGYLGIESFGANAGEAVALETPTMLFIVGGRPGRPYSPPIWATDWRG
jgi:hypothetical protein